ncbi:MAG: hypothetical protein HUU46_02285 [Candidatus Hydrogenedentes bacterium]|nr:hypothetical protein [Candidatus Hydrogenedentota bacterium]
MSEYAAGMTAPCPKCGQPLTVSPQNSKPVARTPAAPIDQAGAAQPNAQVGAPEPGLHYTPLQTASLKTHCARCGREFRGDWDRHPTASGLVCNICRNFVASSAQALQSTGYVAPVDVMKLDPVYDPRPQEPVEVEEVEKSWREKYMPDQAMMQRIAIGAAVAFGLYTVWIIISGAWVVGPSPDELEQAAVIAETADVPKLPMWAGVAMTVLSTCSLAVSTFIGIYIFLTLSHRLPESTFLANAVQLLPATAIITVVFFSVSVLAGPILGTILLLLVIPPLIFINFGFESQDIINFPLGIFLGGVLQSMAYLLIYWVIGAIAL